jgi:hypothetical protein
MTGQYPPVFLRTAHTVITVDVMGRIHYPPGYGGLLVGVLAGVGI